jgi:NAD(P)-dependent dehydrogenase (short-subunit alcohol dehydrogenase family)
MNSKPVVIVTGASRGIGAAVARWLAGTGVAVTLLARSESALRCEAESIGRAGGDSLFLAGDVSEPLFCRSAVATTLDRFHRLDALVNNAGMVEPLSAVADARPADWQYNIAVNLLGAVYMSMAAIGELRGRNGRIVNVSSGAANAVIAAASAYCAAKAALNQFSRVLAAEEPDLTVIAVRPGVVDTRMQAILRSQGPGKMPAEQAAFYTDLKTAGRLEPPQVPARAIAWLALHAPREWSGAFMSYDDPRIAEPARATFGGG